MISSFIITFRETLEAALIVGIILAYLIKTKREEHNNVVYLGVGSAIIASIIGAFLFNALAGGFEGKAEQIFEGISMIVGAFLITFMVLWMMKQKHIMSELQKKVDTGIKNRQKIGLFMLVFVSVLREGIETVIFLGAASFVSETSNNLTGALLGVVLAILIGYLIFVIGKRINVKSFFNVTSVVLVLFAAGLVANGIHEFEEAEILPGYIEHVWDSNPDLNEDGSFPLLHQKGVVGSILKDLVGYNASPSLTQLIGYAVYIVVVLILWINIEKIHKVI